MNCDLLIRNGTVIDPVGGREGVLDVAIADGRIAAVDSAIDPKEASETVDASGHLVMPGLVDLHAHVFHSATYWGVKPDVLAPHCGVTTWCDAGSAGGFSIDGFQEWIAAPAHVRVKAFLNISSIGLVGTDWELAELGHLDVELCANAARRHPDLVCGIKVRMGATTVGDNGLEPLRRAREAADACGKPLMVHVAMPPPAVEEVLGLMQRGDILTHCASGLGMGIVDQDQRQLKEAGRRAHHEGIIFDLGHGSGSFSWTSAEALLQAGCPPFALSTDVHQNSIHGPMFDMPTCMSKLDLLGVPLREIVAMSTSQPAELLGLGGEAGTLRPGAQADVTLMRWHEGWFPLYDSHGDARQASRLLRCSRVLVAGQTLAVETEHRVAPWYVENDQQRILRERGHRPEQLDGAIGELAPLGQDPYVDWR